MESPFERSSLFKNLKALACVSAVSLSVRSYSTAHKGQGRGKVGGGAWYLHYIGILPQFFATGGVVGHLALRPPRHRFDPRFSSPPDIQGEQHHD